MNCTRRDVAWLFGLALVVRLGVALLVERAGYMDPAYYAAGAVNLALGEGLRHPYIWNYLGNPAGLPQPGFQYWMPLPSFLAAPFAALLSGSFFALQIPFVLLSALLPLMGYAMAWQVSQRRRHAWVVGGLVVFSGFFFPYWTLPETFAPFALCGALALWLANGRQWWIGGLAGLLAGLAHLTRADGVLLLPVVLLGVILRVRATRGGFRATAAGCSLVALGYLLVMGPWFMRNLLTVGSLLGSGGMKTLWLTTYDDVYCYGCDLSLRAYLAWGWGNILDLKLTALWVNSQRFVAENCLVFLFPLALIGYYRLRRRPPFFLSLVYLLLVYGAHSLAFSYPGVRGGFFHASAPLLPFVYTAAVEGLDAAVGWIGRRRRWRNLRQAQWVFSGAAVFGALILSISVAGSLLPRWRGVDRVYEEVGAWLDQRGMGHNVVVMANNPPALWYHTGRPSVVVPAPVGDVETLLAVADRYRVSYLILDRNWPVRSSEALHPRLGPVAGWPSGEARTVLYEVKR